MSVRVFAPAKINLTLRVAKPRADGMHPLESVVAFADVGDFVEAAASDALSLNLTGPFAGALSAEEDNLVLRAARTLADAAGVSGHARLTLEKNLPVASGIGGGSSDAAAALRALNALWGLDWPDERLASLAVSLGSDVPVFFASRAGAYMSGLGETCAPASIPELPAVLINRLTPLATPSVYRQFDAMGLGSALDGGGAPAWMNADETLHHISVIGNDLEAPAVALAPVVGALLAALRAETDVGYAALSGSGATCFALVESASAAQTLREKLAARYPAYWVCATRLGGA